MKTSVLTRNGFSVEEKDGCAVAQGGVNAVRALADKVKDGTVKWDNDENARHAKECLTSSSDSWRGGSFQSLIDDLSGKKDMAKHHAERDKVTKTGVVDKLRVKAAMGRPRRKRELSDCEGDWDYDRRFEPEQFVRLRKQKKLQRVVDLECWFCANGYQTAERLDRYGAIVWAIADVVETAGVSCRVVFRMKSRSVATDGLGTDLLIEVKKADEYVMPQLLAGTFTTNFFRRMGFALDIAACDSVGREATHGLGRADNFEGSVKFEDGKLMTSPELIQRGEDKMDELEAAIMEALG